eukprot:6490812-Amphidinium_carterae.3
MQRLVDITQRIGPLDFLTTSNGQLRCLDAFFFQALRHIINVPPTYVDRSWTNLRVLNTARGFILSTRGRASADKLMPFSALYNTKCASLLGHLLRASFSDPLWKATLHPQGKTSQNTYANASAAHD